MGYSKETPTTGGGHVERQLAGSSDMYVLKLAIDIGRLWNHDTHEVKDQCPNKGIGWVGEG